MPGNVPFERFVEGAFRAKLLVAGVEAAEAPVTLTGRLNACTSRHIRLVFGN